MVECTPVKPVTTIYTLLPSSPLAYPTDSTTLLVTSYLLIKTLVSRQQSTQCYVLEVDSCSKMNMPLSLVNNYKRAKKIMITLDQ